jgi:hypothetical protein
MKDDPTLSIEVQAAEAVRKCLAEVPFLVIEESQAEPHGAPASILAVRCGRRRKVLLVEARTSGEPRFAREAVNSLQLRRNRFPNAAAVFVAPYISPRGAEICRAADVSYVDLAGNCAIGFDQVFIRREGQKNPLARRRALRSLFSPRAERVLRVLLTDPRKHWKMQQLAVEAQVSLGLVANVKRLLLDREWIRAGKTGIVLGEPRALLDDWATAYDPARSTPRSFYSFKEPREVEAALTLLCQSRGVLYALTGFSAAARLAPFVRTQQAEAYLAGAIEDIAASLQLREVASGANVRLIEPYDEGVFYGSSTIDGIPLVAPVQAYLDLRSTKGRGEEAAAFLLQEAIIPRW